MDMDKILRSTKLTLQPNIYMDHRKFRFSPCITSGELYKGLGLKVSKTITQSYFCGHVLTRRQYYWITDIEVIISIYVGRQFTLLGLNRDITEDTEQESSQNNSLCSKERNCQN